MIDFDRLNQDLIGSKPYFKAVSPGPRKLFVDSVPEMIRLGAAGYTTIKSIRSKNPGHEIVGDLVTSQVLYYTLRPVKRFVTKTHKRIPDIPKKDFHRKNGMGGRSWYTTPRKEEMVIIFHDANRAGPHIDVHIGRLSIIYKVKPDLYEKLRYNRKGVLTADSQKLLIEHVKSEIARGARVPQNLDHSKAEAKITWTGKDDTGTNYGSGKTRQIISTSHVDIYKAHRDGPIEMYAPSLNSHRSLYLYRIYNGPTPILIFGAKTSVPPFLHDRLHLKLTDPSALLDKDLFAARVDLTTSTAKYDGSSAYLHITPKGTTAWSPRRSVVTGEQIEYTFKLPGLADVTSDVPIVAMGEVLFKKKSPLPRLLRFDEHTYLSSAEGSGILNSNLLVPDHLEPEIRLYRVDSIGKDKTIGLDFWTNRILQQEVAKLSPLIKVVQLMTPDEAKVLGYEGIVATSPGSSVVEGMKIKWWTDPNDWRIDKVKFYPGEKGSVAGVVQCTSLDSGKKFNLGPGQVGNQLLTREMMANPQRYEGLVLKVLSRHGHEGRAAKVQAFHDDKGMG
jgi:hypothetical protein